MLLRVDVTGGGNASTHPHPSSNPPLHACLATATVQTGGESSGAADGGDNALTQGGSQIIGGVPHAIIPASPHGEDAASSTANRSGEILTVGRKNCIVTIDDKCVSRGHATISLLSNHALDDEAVAMARQALDGRIMMEFGTPSTPEEIRACETSPLGVICVVKDMGSKFGTYVSVDEQLVREFHGNDSNGNGNNAGGGGGGDETGDETDDEAAGAVHKMDFVELTDKQTRAVHLLWDNNEDPSNRNAALPKFQKLAAHQSVPLLQLSHNSKQSNPHALILFGPQGSAIRLSLLPLQFTFSRIKKPELDSILATLHYVGATHSSQWDVQHSTHLVAPDKTAAAKGIMAWACRRPVVTKGYIDALLERRDAMEELPREEDYCPNGSWDAKLKYTAEPSTALKGYRIAVMVDDDNAPLAQSAGADILPLHELAPTNSSHGEFETWWRTQTQKALNDKLALVVVSSSSKKCKQWSDWLKHDEDVRFTNAKNIAKAITGNDGEGLLLTDVKKVEIEKIDGWDAVVEKEEDAKKVAAADTSAAETAVKAPEKETADKMDQDDENPSFANNDHYEEAEEEMPVSTRRKRRQEESAAELEEEQRQPEKQKRRRKHEEDPVEREVNQAEDEELPEAEEAPAEEAAAADERPAPAGKRKAPKKRVAEESSDDEPGCPDERVPLPTTQDGWLVAAPKKRKMYRKGRDEHGTIDENVPDKSAETEKVSGLIVRKYVPPEKGAGGTGRSFGRAARNNGAKKKDFKRFRKNCVIRGYTSFNGSSQRQYDNVPKVRLVERLPKESERQRQLQQQQEDLDREQELADQLFNDVGGTKTGRKRKTGSGTMHAFLSQSTTKRGRGRR